MKVKSSRKSMLKRILEVYFDSAFASFIINIIYINAYRKKVDENGYKFNIENNKRIKKDFVSILGTSLIPVFNILVATLESTILLTNSIDSVVDELKEDECIIEKDEEINNHKYNKIYEKNCNESVLTR